MLALDRRKRVVAIGLAGAAGMVDAIGFLASGGFFLSFMSGNSTRLAVGLFEQAAYVALVSALLASFVAGVTCGSLLGRMKGISLASIARVKLLMLALLLAAAPLAAQAGAVTFALCITAFCMGTENTIFEREGSVSFGLTYMTGALVKIGQGVATALSGGEKTAWLPFALLWGGLLGGAVGGAALFSAFGLFALWLPAALMVVFGLTTRAWAL